MSLKNQGFKNIEQFKKTLEKRLSANPHKNSLRAVGRSTLLVNNTVVKSIAAGGAGKTVKKYEPTRTHTQSKPLDPPATDTGFLISQITSNIKTFPNGSVVGQIISSAPYSKALEFGTTNMTERPFMQPALRKNKKKILDIFKKEGVIR
jgi:HK97 gp10 family phage protein